MSLFRNKSGYEAKKPVMANPNDGLSVKEILAKAAGKSSGADLTIDDIQSVISKANLSERDAKRVMKGASKFMGSGYDYRLKGEGTYDVFQDGKPMSGTSRSAGNRRGKDFLGDIGVGRNVSMLVGLADQVKPAATPTNPTPGFTPKEFKIQEFTPASMLAGFSTRNGSGNRPAGTTTTTGGGGKGRYTGGGKKTEVAETTSTQDVRVKGTVFDPTKPAVPINEIDLSKEPGWNESVSAYQNKEKERLEKLYQNQYSTFLKNKYSMLYGHLTKTQRVNSANGRMALNRDVSNLKQTQPNLYSYLVKHHGDQLKEIGITEFANGGVLKGGTGIKTPWKPFNAWEVNEELNLDIPTSTPRINPSRGTASAASLIKGTTGKINQTSRVTNLSPEVQAAMKTYAKATHAKKVDAGNAVSFKSGKGQYEVTNPKKDIDPFNNGSKWLDVAGTAGKYILPFIGEGLARKAWDNVKPIKWNDANYLVGNVRDLPKPNFALRSRNPIASDVQTEIASSKFGDAQQRDAEANYWLQNALSKLEQENQIMARTNEGVARNKQGELQTNMVNAQTNAGKAAAIAESYREPFVAAQQHLNQDMSSKAYLDFSKKAGLAEQVLKYGEGSPYYDSAMKWISARKGGKLKKNC